MQENLWMHTLGPSSVSIQSEAIYEVYKSKSNPEISITASDWIGAFKGPKVCAPRFSCTSSLRLQMQENRWVPGLFGI